MRILENNEKLMVSGGNLTQDILNLFRPKQPDQENTWVNPSTIESPSYGKGSDFGKLFVGIFAAAAAIVGVVGTVVARSLVAASISEK